MFLNIKRNNYFHISVIIRMSFHCASISGMLYVDTLASSQILICLCIYDYGATMYYISIELGKYWLSLSAFVTFTWHVSGGFDGKASGNDGELCIKQKLCRWNSTSSGFRLCHPYLQAWLKFNHPRYHLSALDSAGPSGPFFSRVLILWVAEMQRDNGSVSSNLSHPGCVSEVLN